MSEEIKYIFTGDSAPLEKSAQQALSALDSVSKAEKSVSDTSAFGPITNALGLLAQNYRTIATAQDYYNQSVMSSISGITQEASVLQVLGSQLSAVTSQASAFTNTLGYNLTSSSAQVNSALTSMGSTFENACNPPLLLESNLDSVNTSLDRCNSILGIASSSCATESQALTSMSSAYKNVDMNAQSAQTALSQTISPIQQNIQGAGKLQIVLNAVSRMWDIAKRGAAAWASVISSVAKACAKAFTAIHAAAKKLSDGLKSLKEKAGNALTGIMKLLGVASLGDAIGKCINASNDYIETLNLFTVASGDFYDSMKANADVLTYYGGLSEQVVMQAAGSFKLLATEMGVTQKVAADMSNSLTNVSVDLSSLFNQDFETVMQDMESGLQGMTRSVRKYGIDISKAALAETAAQLGLQKNVETMSQAEKVQLRYATIIRQSTLSQTDFARTIMTPANMLKILKEQITEAARSIGNLLQPALQLILPILIKVALTVKTVASSFATLFNITGKTSQSLEGTSRNASDNFTNIADSTDTASKNAKSIKKSLAGFDELNILNSSNSSSSDADGTSGIGGSDLGVNLPSYDNMLAMTDFMPNLRSQADQLSQTFMAWTQPIQDALSTLKGPLSETFSSLKEAGKSIFGNVADAARTNFIDNVIPVIKTVIDVVGQLAPVIADLVQQLMPVWIAFNNIESVLVQALLPVVVTFAQSVLPPIIKFIGDIVTSVQGFVTQIAPVLTPFLNTIMECLGQLLSSILPLVSGAIKAILDVLGPIISAVLPVLQDILSSVIGSLCEIIDAILPPLLDLFNAILVPLGDIVMQLLPVLQKLFDTLVPIFTRIIKEILPPIIKLITSIIKPLMQILQDLLIPLVDLCISLLAPILDILITVIGVIIRVLTPIIQIIINIIDFCLQPIIGVIQFLIQVVRVCADAIGIAISGICRIVEWMGNVVGSVFDWFANKFQWLADRARGITNTVCALFTSIADAVRQGFIGAVNGVIWALNKVLSGVEWLVNAALKPLNALCKGLNYIPGVDIPELKVSIPKIPKLATGGVVTGPTQVLAGEGLYDEAVIPLGNSPQLEDMLDKFADKVKDSGGGDTVVYVLIDGEQVDASIEKRKKRNDIIYNGGR